MSFNSDTATGHLSLSCCWLPSSFSISTAAAQVERGSVILVYLAHSVWKRLEASSQQEADGEREREREREKSQSQRLCAHVAICLEPTENRDDKRHPVPTSRETSKKKINKKRKKRWKESAASAREFFSIQVADVIKAEKVWKSHPRCPWTRSLFQRLFENPPNEESVMFITKCIHPISCPLPRKWKKQACCVVFGTVARWRWRRLRRKRRWAASRDKPSWTIKKPQGLFLCRY